MSALALAPTLVHPHVGLRGLLPDVGLERYEHFLDAYGAAPRGRQRLLELIEQSGLTGRGGAGFPTARKLRAVAGGRRAVVVANGIEGEPTSDKDKTLMRRNPHLVLDGAVSAAELVGARRVILAVGRDADVGPSLERALRERSDEVRVELAAVPERFVAGEETALVHFLNGGEAKPTLAPPRPFECGVAGRPTLVQNVETLASLALIARYGPDWFRSSGTGAEPGTVLATVSGAVRASDVVEVPLGTPLGRLLERCGGPLPGAQAYLIGGYFGRWVPANEQLRLSDESLARVGGRLGARALVVLGSHSCGVVESARVVSYMASQSAQQCGPCVFGLRALADRLASVARCEPGAMQAFRELAGLHRQIARRGACGHPDGVLDFAASALRVFGSELQEHLAGRCSAHDHQAVLPTPTPTGGWR